MSQAIDSPTEKQLKLLKFKGYKGPAPTSKKEASAAIEQILGGSTGKTSSKLDITQLGVAPAEVTAILNEADDVAKKALIVLSKVEEVCKAAGIPEGAKTGMIYNQVMENIRFVRKEP